MIIRTPTDNFNHLHLSMFYCSRQVHPNETFHYICNPSRQRREPDVRHLCRSYQCHASAPGGQQHKQETVSANGKPPAETISIALPQHETTSADSWFAVKPDVKLPSTNKLGMRYGRPLPPHSIETDAPYVTIVGAIVMRDNAELTTTAIIRVQLDGNLVEYRGCDIIVRMASRPAINGKQTYRHKRRQTGHLTLVLIVAAVTFVGSHPSVGLAPHPSNPILGQVGPPGMGEYMCVAKPRLVGIVDIAIAIA